jgi:hypothetical protein
VTPLEEGNDPLSLPSTSAPAQSAATKTTQARLPLNRLASDSLDPPWGRDMNGDASKGTERVPHTERRSPESSSSYHQSTENGHIRQEESDKESEEEFVYPGSQEAAAPTVMRKSLPEDDTISPSDAPDLRSAERERLPQEPTSQSVRRAELTETSVDEAIQSGSRLNPAPSSFSAKPIDYTRLSQLCSQGPLSSLKSFFENATSPAPEGSAISAFALASEPNPASGLAPIHYAAREGRCDVMKWLVQEAGALVEMEDREGEVST